MPHKRSAAEPGAATKRRKTTILQLLYKLKLCKPKEPELVWVVYKSHGEWEGNTVYAICYSSELAEKARVRLAAELQNPIRAFEVAEVATNAVHLYGFLVQDGSFDIEEKG